MRMNCMSCDHQLICKSADDDEYHVCSMYDPVIRRTNADRIRSMSDEELAELLYETETQYLPIGLHVENDWLAWLKQEVAND